jgi:hypothetical protein
MAKARTGRRSATHVREDQNGCPVIGWREWLSIPSLRIDRIKAKIDTGARTSAIHAYHIEKINKRGTPHISFIIHPIQRQSTPAIPCIAELRDERVVRSSSGHVQRRYVIEVDVSLGDRTWPIELTLADRDPMGFRMLLGRQALRNQFLIDPDQSFIVGRVFADVKAVTAHRRTPR